MRCKGMNCIPILYQLTFSVSVIRGSCWTCQQLKLPVHGYYNERKRSTNYTQLYRILAEQRLGILVNECLDRRVVVS